MRGMAADIRVFLSTPSARRATSVRFEVPASRTHFYPRPPRGGRRALSDQEYKAVIISIHALREEGDADPFAGLFTVPYISIHALREEGDPL